LIRKATLFPKNQKKNGFRGFYFEKLDFSLDIDQKGLSYFDIFNKKGRKKPPVTTLEVCNP